MNVFNIINISSIIIYTKIIDISIKPCFFILSIDQSLEIYPKHNGPATVSESFALNLSVSVRLTNKYLFAPLKCKLKQNFFFVTVKLIEYIFSAVKVCFNPCFGPVSNTNMSFCYYQYEQKNANLLHKLIHFDHIHHLEIKNFLFYQIQFHNQNIHTYQYQHF